MIEESYHHITLYFSKIFHNIKEILALALKLTLLLIVSLLVLSFIYLISFSIYVLFYKFILVPPSSMIVSSPLYFKYPQKGAMKDPVWTNACLSPMSKGYKYKFTVSLVLPSIPSNYESGVFNVIVYPHDNPPYGTNLLLDFGFPDPYVLYEHEHPMFLPWKNNFVRTLENVVYAFPRLIAEVFGMEMFKDEKSITATFTNEFIFDKEDSNEQCVLVVVSNPHVIVYGGMIHGRVKMEGWRYIVYNWFITSAFIGTSLIFGTISSIIILIGVAIFLKKKFSKRQSEKREMRQEEEMRKPDDNEKEDQDQIIEAMEEPENEVIQEEHHESPDDIDQGDKTDLNKLETERSKEDVSESETTDYPYEEDKVQNEDEEENEEEYENVYRRHHFRNRFKRNHYRRGHENFEEGYYDYSNADEDSAYDTDLSSEEEYRIGNTEYEGDLEDSEHDPYGFLSQRDEDDDNQDDDENAIKEGDSNNQDSIEEDKTTTKQ